MDGQAGSNDGGSDREWPFPLSVLSLGLTAFNSLVILWMLLWLCRHPALRGSTTGNNMGRRAKRKDPKNIVTIDYRMSEGVEEAARGCPQRRGVFTIGLDRPSEGATSRTRSLAFDSIEMGSFSSSSERVAPEPIHEDTIFTQKFV